MKFSTLLAELEQYLVHSSRSINIGQINEWIHFSLYLPWHSLFAASENLPICDIVGILSHKSLNWFFYICYSLGFLNVIHIFILSHKLCFLGNVIRHYRRLDRKFNMVSKNRNYVQILIILPIALVTMCMLFNYSKLRFLYIWNLLVLCRLYERMCKKNLGENSSIHISTGSYYRFLQLLESQLLISEYLHSPLSYM